MQEVQALAGPQAHSAACREVPAAEAVVAPRLQDGPVLGSLKLVEPGAAAVDVEVVEDSLEPVVPGAVVDMAAAETVDAQQVV